MCIADSGNHRVRKVSTPGVISTVAGDGTYGNQGYGDGGSATAARLRTLTGVALDSIGNLYIADQDDTRMRKVSAPGIISTVAGDGTYGDQGDGGPAVNASIPGFIFIAVSRWSDPVTEEPCPLVH